MSYDDWKTRAPDPEDDKEQCGCVWTMNHGIRFLVERCEEHEALYQEEEERLRAARKPSEDDGDDIPF